MGRTNAYACFASSGTATERLPTARQAARSAFSLWRIAKFVRPEAMKRVAILAAAIALAALTSTTAMAASLGRQLVDLESHVKWSAVENAWRNLRDDWVRTTARCDEPACVAAQMLQFEQNVKWQAVDKEWRERRPAWLNDCKGATTEADVARLLLEFEANVRWRAVDERWKARRDSWIAEIKGG